MARATKKVATKKRGSQDDTMYVVSYRRFLTWKAAWVAETETKAKAWADERRAIEGPAIAFKVEPVKYVG